MLVITTSVPVASQKAAKWGMPDKESTMKPFLSAVVAGCVTVLVLTSAPVTAADKGLTLNQIRSNSSPAKALALHQSLQKRKITPTQFHILERNAKNLRNILRKRAPISSDQQWANLIAPINFCTDLVRKVCGAEKQCADASTCAITITLLDLYNAETDAEEQHEQEGSCIIALDDNIVFPQCQ